MERFLDYLVDQFNRFYQYLFKRIDLTDLKDLNYTVVDLETTGFQYPPIDRIIEIGAVRIENLTIRDTFSTLVNPLKKIPQIAKEVTGITDEDVANAPTIGKALKEFFRFSTDTVIIAYNVSFDYHFIQETSKLSLGYVPEAKTLCAFELSKKILYFLDRYDLDVVAEYLNIKIENRHRALGDAIATAKIFLLLIDILRKIGITNYSEAKLFEKANLTQPKIKELLEHYRRLGII
jgi:DNA polymerase III epsilon subunit family exonuclease